MDSRRFVNQVVAGVAVVVLASAARAGTIYVDDDNCPGPGSGTPGDPYCSIQTAIDNAVDTDEIVVAPGTYVEAIDFLEKSITLRSSDGPDLTIIDGTGNLHTVQCVAAAGMTAVLDGFTITGGNANGDYPHDSGGGMLNFESSALVTNCTFTGNAAFYGGGISNDGGSPMVTNCTFTGNTAFSGGGIHIAFTDQTVAGCTFSDNAAFTGGGMYNHFCNTTVTDCTFSGNTADAGGGMYNSSSTPTLADSTFCGNSPDHIGGSDGSVDLQGQIAMSAFCPVPVCPSDTTGDGEVSVVDFLALLANWGPCP